MVTQKIKLTLKRYFTRTHQPQPESGFTLPELLMAILVGGMVTYGMLALVVSLLGTERQETAKSQVQQEMNQALDYIASEIQQAVYIYREDNFPPLAALNLGANVQPVIAFWKATPIQGDDLDDFLKGVGDPPCPTNHPNPDCSVVLTNLQTFNLVIYGVQENPPGEIWQEGASRIIRYELKQYRNFENLDQTAAYIPPNFSDPNWEPNGTINWNNPGTFRAVLVDGLDSHDVNEPDRCSPNLPVYTLATPLTDQPNNSFYACVRGFNTEVSQDAILFLRGNAAMRAGQPNSRNTAYLPSFERRVQARTVLGRRPPK
jgi:prepilin-type N-terminal cleavage/methylation domain-containing protein